MVGMIFAAVDYPLNFAFYARQNSTLPAIVGVISVGFYLLAAWALMGPLGYLGLVWADTVKQISHALIMIALISWQVGMHKEGLGKGILWIGLAGLGAGVLAWGVAQGFDELLAAGLAHDVALLLVAGGSALACYVLILRWARLPELVTIGAWLRQRLGR